MAATEPTTIRYDVPRPGVARITLARVEQRNAQSRRMLYEVNDAFERAAHDDDVRVLVVAADGPHFSSGHDLSDREPMDEFEPVGCWGGFGQPGAEGHWAMEEEIYLGFCWRWRNMPKPTIAQVHGKAIAGGLMLIWPCDLVVASEDATFSDPVVAFGVNGVEYAAHVWELGARKAKEMLFLGEEITAADAKALGMVNRVVPRERLEDEVLAMAEKIASRPRIGLTLAKQAVNEALDAQGMWTALRAGMSLHQLGHSHNRELFGIPVDPSGAETIRREAKAKRAEG